MKAGKPRLLDLFCGAGGAAMGYHRAGFDVVGVDIKPQPHYPFEFHHADAMAMRQDVVNGCWHEGVTTTLPGRLRACLGHFDAIHASPPCQAYSKLKTSFLATRKHPELVLDVQGMLAHSGLPWVCENVPGAPVFNPLTLCGSMFELGCVCDDGEYRQLRRHRLFSSSQLLMSPGICRHAGQAIGVYGHGRWTAPRDRRRGGYQGSTREKREAAGVPWAAWDEIGQVVPPAYTEWIGTQLLAALERAA